MKFKVSELSEKLNLAVGSLERKATIPVLRNILLDNNFLVATDLDVTFKTKINTFGESLCVDGPKLAQIVKLLDPDADIELKPLENFWCEVKSGKTKYKLAGVDKSSYPEIYEVKGELVTIKDLKKLVRHTQFAITNETSRFTLSGAKLECKDGKAKMVTTDGHRLAIMETTYEGEKEIDCLIPKKGLIEASKLKGDVRLSVDNHHVWLGTDDTAIIVRKLTGNFPNYEMVLPKDNDQTVKVKLAAYRDAIRRISLMSDPRNQSIRVTLRKNELEFSAQSSEEGDAVEVVECEYPKPTEKERVFGYNFKYLLDYFATVEVEDLTFTFKDTNNATDFQADENSRYIVMPLRI